MSILKFKADFQRLLRSAAKAGGFTNPVAFDADDFASPMLKASIPGAHFPLEGVFIRDWDPDHRRTYPGTNFGLRSYQIDGIPYIRAYCSFTLNTRSAGYDLFFCERSNHGKLYRAAVRAKQKSKPVSSPPVMDPNTERALRRNSIEYLEPTNLARIAQYGGKAKRGLLLTGPPGNGKTSACRWVYEECLRRNWDCKTITADDYQAARRDCKPAEAVKELFTVSGRGVIIFDDLDLALRDRDTVKETDDQSVFLTALDGIEVAEAVVYIFTTNCKLELIDPAFRRPGRIDLTLSFPKPDEKLRIALIDRWDQQMADAVGRNKIIRDTDNLSFAEIEELKNLLIVYFLDSGVWDWNQAYAQYHTNRNELMIEKSRRKVGFGAHVADRAHSLDCANGTPAS